MKKNNLFKKSILVIIISLAILSICQKVYASSLADLLQPVEYTEEYKKWLNLTTEEKEGLIEPRMYEVSQETIDYTNPLKFAKMLGSSVSSKYSLSQYIPENTVVRNQQTTNLCWAFAALGQLETNLGLKNYYDGKAPIAYDFSERHMEYATSRTFLNGIINENGFNREVGAGGNYIIATPYLTNGTGAINEEEMPFENNEDKIEITEIQDKTVTAQVQDTVVFAAYDITTDDIEEIKTQMKEHIKNYGGIMTSIHGASLMSEYYNEETGAIYCDNSQNCPINHAVLIIGWDDKYDVENFNPLHMPQNKGAWIIKNSWGTDVGDEGIMYISYEDVNVYIQQSGLTKTSDKVQYDYIYQYNELGRSTTYMADQESTIYLGNIFSKNTTETEYLTEISLYATEISTCKVYVNVNSTSLETGKLEPVELVSGESETIGVGYHTLEFLNPVEINESDFAVVVEMTGTGEYFTFPVEKKTSLPSSIFYTVKTETDKCFIKIGLEDKAVWYDLGKELGADSTIKAFTVSEITDTSLKNIEIIKDPDDTEYFIGEDFDKTGMKVTAYYNDETSWEIIGYDITNGANLVKEQTSVTITYKDKSVEQPITVKENKVVSLEIKQQPSITTYFAGDNFNPKGLIIEATYEDGTIIQTEEYEIIDGTNLTNTQTSVTISFGGKKITQAITVNKNDVVLLEIKQQPTRTEYIVGQNFDASGMIIEATYANGKQQQITNYIITNGQALTIEQTSVTISFEDKTIEVLIKVEAKSVVSITIKQMPEKTEYTQSREQLDLSGGKIEILYNDGQKQELDMTSNDITVTNFDNSTLGENIVKLEYQGKTTQLKVKIIERPQPENSDFKQVMANINNMKVYFYTDKTKTEYMLMEMSVDNIKRSHVNDDYEYYYYLSPSQKEDKIENWVQITEKQNLDSEIVFTINTQKISNYQAVSSADTLYLYIKEIAIRDGEQKAITTDSIKLELKTEVEEYLDDVKIAEVLPNEPEDNTIATQPIPNAGNKMLKILIIVSIISAIGILSYKRYQNIDR